MKKSLFKIGKKIIQLKYVILPKHLAQFGKALTKNKKDLIFNITGYPGEGKSVLGIQIAKAYDRRFNFDRNLIYSRSELMEKIETFPPSAFIIDEAINVLYKREWNKGGQKEMIKLLNICRSKGHMLIFIQPNFEDMDKDIRNKRLRLWVDVIKRGVGVMWKPIKSLGGGTDPWNLDFNDKLVKTKVKKFGIVEGYIEGAAKSQNFQNIVRWDNLTPEEYAQYERVKDEKKYAEEENTLLTEKEAEKISRKKIFEILAILKENKFLKRGFPAYISENLGISIASISTYLKEAKISLNLNSSDSSKDEGDSLKI